MIKVKVKVEEVSTTIEVEKGKTILELLLAISKPLAQKAIIAEIVSSGNSQTQLDRTQLVSLVDLSHVIDSDSEIRIITSEDERALDTLNHSCAHIMACAIKKIYPDAKFAIGPSIRNGFYYDFDIDEKTISQEDLPVIEEEMKGIIEKDYKFERQEVTKAEAKEIFRNNPFKLELIDEIESPKVSIYTTGNFVDLCSGPHIPSTGKVGAFKLLSIAGAYWRGDERNKMLTRIYGASFFSEEDLQLYLERAEKAKNSDHRKIGKDLELFSFHDEAPGFPFFHPRGIILRNIIIDYWRKEHQKEGYLEIQTPVILSNELWKTSGHWDNYKDNMYFVNIEEKDYAIKPMNCPGAILVYKSSQHSYRELPLKYAELGLVHRHEKSGVLHGLFRVRSFTQDDAHIFCMESQLKDEITKIIDLVDRMYRVFGFHDYHVELSTRPLKRIGTDKMWDKAENALEEVVKAKDINYVINKGEGAFYGPKIDFHITDCFGRTWQCATIQLDFAMPEKFDIEYMGEDNAKHRPVMLHRVVLGSIERFIGILIEHYSGNLPPWLAPVQAVVLPISEKFGDYSRRVFDTLRANNFRVEFDNRVESLNKKIRDAELKKIPYMIVIGKREEETRTITIRRKVGEDMREIELDKFLSILKDVVENKKSTS
ncbi:MAG: threonine--tRNA ligase [Actinobacteria bacterium]|nr:threonine--tRNA ligase [Actinomycetota bacterium]